MPVSLKDDEVGDVEADLDLVGIPPEVAKYAREKLGETPDSTVRTLQELRDMIYGELVSISFRNLLRCWKLNRLIM